MGKAPEAGEGRGNDPAVEIGEPSLTGVPREASRLTNSHTCSRSQTNRQREPTNGNYIGRGPTNRNYTWESRLFLPSLIRRTEMGERGVSDRPEHSQADPSRGGGMGQPGGGGA